MPKTRPALLFVLFLPVLVAVLALPAVAARAAGERVRDPWIRYVSPGAPAAGYFVLVNDTDRTIHLTGARSPAFREVMLHRTSAASGVARMQHVESVALRPHAELAVAPGGYHLMLMGPTRPLAPGERVRITLEFGEGGSLEAEFVVRGPGG